MDEGSCEHRRGLLQWKEGSQKKVDVEYRQHEAEVMPRPLIPRPTPSPERQKVFVPIAMTVVCVVCAWINKALSVRTESDHPRHWSYSASQQRCENCTVLSKTSSYRLISCIRAETDTRKHLTNSDTMSAVERCSTINSHHSVRPCRLPLWCSSFRPRLFFLRKITSAWNQEFRTFRNTVKRWFSNISVHNQFGFQTKLSSFLCLG